MSESNRPPTDNRGDDESEDATPQTQDPGSAESEGGRPAVTDSASEHEVDNASADGDSEAEGTAWESDQNTSSEEASTAAQGLGPRPSDQAGEGARDSGDAATPDSSVATTAAAPPGKEAVGDEAGRDAATRGSDEPMSEGGEPTGATAETGRRGDTGTATPTSTGGASGTKTRRTGGGDGGRWWRGVGPLIAALVVLALLATIVGGGYWLRSRIQQLEQRLAQVPAERERALERFARSDALAQSIDRLESDVQSQIESVKQEIAQVSEQASKANQSLSDRLESLKEAVATARELAGRDQLDWRLAEVHYLVAVAARRLAISHDRRAAIAAMKAADRSLAAVGDVRLLDLRQRLIDDITALEQTEPADVEGIALRIQSLLQRIPELPPRQQRRQHTDGADGGDSGSGGAVAAWWQRVQDSLSDYVVVRRQGGADGPSRPRADKGLPAGEKLGYALSEARRAALRREPDPFAGAIEQARSVLDKHFASESATVAYFRKTLDELAERNVTTAYPDLTDTLDHVEKVTAKLKARRDRPDLVESPGEE